MRIAAVHQITGNKCCGGKSERQLNKIATHPKCPLETVEENGRSRSRQARKIESRRSPCSGNSFCAAGTAIAHGIVMQTAICLSH